MIPAPVILLTTFAVGSVYSYLIYPLLLLFVPGRRDEFPAVSGTGTEVTLIIAAHNEAARISEKIDNTLSLRTQFPDLEIIVASDASDDGTDEIVAARAGDGVRLVRSAARIGKEFAQGLAIDATTRPIVVFTDVGTAIEPSSIARIIAVFANPEIGAVSSVDQVVTESNEPVGEGLYVRYEMWLRAQESRRAGLIGLSGSFFAARREVLDNWDPTIPSDFCVAINARLAGFRSVSDPAVIGRYKNVASPADEVSRKIRTVLRGMAALSAKAGMMNPVKHGQFAFQLISHKLMRWAAPWFALGYLVTAVIATLRDPVYAWSFVPVVAAGIPILVGTLLPASRTNAIVGPLYYLCVTNVAVLRASLAYLSGRRITSWSPSRR